MREFEASLESDQRCTLSNDEGYNTEIPALKISVSELFRG